MPFCANCGSEVKGSFCEKCGTPVGGGAPGPSGQQPSGQGVPPSGGGLDDNIASLLCYLGGVITGIIFLVLAPYNQKKLIRFHAFQSIFLFLGLIAVWIVLGSVLGFILPWMITGLLFTLLQLGCLGLWIYLMVTAYQGKKIVLPVVGPMAEKQA